MNADASAPATTRLKSASGMRKAAQKASSVMNVLVLALVVLSGVMWLAAPWIVPNLIVSPVFASKPGQLDLAIELTRIMLLSPIFMGLSSLVTGVLQSYRQFLAGAIAPLVYNLSLIHISEPTR